MLRYLKGLEWPKGWGDFVDLLSKTVIAATIAAVGVVYSHYQKLDDRRSAQAEAVRSRLSDQRDAIGLFVEVMPQNASEPKATQKLNFLSAYCDAAKITAPPPEPDWWQRTLAKVSPPGNRASVPVDAPDAVELRVTKALCDEVRAFGQAFAAEKQPAATASAAAAVRTNDASVYVDSPAAAALNAAVSASEAGAPVTGKDWYAVIASVPLSQPEVVPSLVASLNAKLEKAGLPPRDVKVYETEISGHFALTSGGPKTEKDAKARAAMLRRAGVASDAFAQPDRNWKRSSIGG